MAYFNELPNISYPSLLPRSNKVEDRIEVKNIFKRAKLRDDVDQAITAFNYYQIEDVISTNCHSFVGAIFTRTWRPPWLKAGSSSPDPTWLC